MSKFYYSGKIEQVNTLTSSDIFLSYIFGNWQLMILEGVMEILFSIATFVFYFFYRDFYTAIPNLYSIALSGLMLSFAAIDFIAYFIYKRKGIKKFLRTKGILEVLGALFSYLFKTGFLNFCFLIIAMLLFSTGFIMFKIQKAQGGSILFSAFCMISGIVIIALNFIQPVYKELVFSSFIGLLGIIIVYFSIGFRRSMKKYIDEQLGFTDYEIY